MLSDLAALTPPLVVAVAFGIGVVLFLRRQLGPAGRQADDDGAEISGDPGNAGGVDHPPAPRAGGQKV